MRYEWRDGNDNPVAIEGDPNESWNLRYFLDWGEGLQPVCDESISWGAELSRLAEENRALRAESEEYQLFGGELVGRLGLDREEMEEKPGAVGNQILAVIDERVGSLRGFVVWHRHDGDLVKLIPIPAERETAIDRMEVAEGPPIEIRLFP